MMKKILTVLLAAALSLTALAGCGAKDEWSWGSYEEIMAKFEGEIERNVTIRILENDTAKERGYLKELLAAFNKEYAEYGITAVDANMDQYNDLLQNGPDGYGPDVLYQANDIIMNYADHQAIQPLPVDQLDFYDKVPQSAWDAYKKTVDGVDYYCAAPVNVQEPLLYYRKDLLPADWDKTWDKNKNGKCDIVETWNDMYAFSKSVYNPQQSKYGYMKSIFDPYFSLGFLFSYGGYLFGGDDHNDIEDIGLAKNGAEKGAWVLHQLAGNMNGGCVDDAITLSSYDKIASGEYFATITTPDVYETFIDKLAAQYKRNDKTLTTEAADAKARENLVMTALPKLPADGDLSADILTGGGALIDSKVMGGINGYAVSAYSESPKASLAFIKFATAYDMISRRADLLGIAPARKDVAEAKGGISQYMYDTLENGIVSLMPSTSAITNVWTYTKTFFTSIAKDGIPATADKDKKFTSLESFKKELEKTVSELYDALHILDGATGK